MVNCRAQDSKMSFWERSIEKDTVYSERCERNLVRYSVIYSQTTRLVSNFNNTALSHESHMGKRRANDKFKLDPWKDPNV